MGQNQRDVQGTGNERICRETDLGKSRNSPLLLPTTLTDKQLLKQAEGADSQAHIDEIEKA